MRNIVGQPVSGNDYYLRKEITNLIYRRLTSGSNLFMAAPRRVGKTSIMFHLRDDSKDNFTFIYLPTESINSSELYFKRLFEALLSNDIVDWKIKNSEKAKSIFENITKRFKKISAFGFELELKSAENENYADLFLDLVKKLNCENKHIILMIDEFPSTIENITKKHGETEAIQFLKLNRTIRQESAGGIQFIYTGSIGLPAVVNRLDTPESINDLNQIEIPPLNENEGKEFIEKLFSSADVPYESNVIEYLLVKIKWLMPFFLQLSVQELIDIYDQNQEDISQQMVNLAFERICSRRNNIHFDSYYKRLQGLFSKKNHKIVIKILNIIARDNTVSKTEIVNELEVEENDRELNSILESLEYDGYINLNQNSEYIFNSPILQLWWNKYIRN